MRADDSRLAAVAVAFAAAVALAGCGSGGSSSTGASGGSGGASASAPGAPSPSSATAEAQSAATGDIPDNQQFLRYDNRSARYSVLYPEGWARKGAGGDVTWSDKDNQVRVTVSGGGAPSVAAAKAALTNGVAKGDQLKVQSAATTSINGRPAIHITYQVLGSPNPVTGKRLTLMVDRYVLTNNGRVAVVDESTPLGVDNVDAYRMIIQSFRWS